MDKIAKGSLLHFIYVPFVVVHFSLHGESLNSVILISSIALFISGGLCVYSLLVILIFTKIIEPNRFLLYTIPSLIMGIFYSSIQSMASNIDFGGKFLLPLIFIGTFILNLINYVYVNRDEFEPDYSQILDK